MEEFDSMIFFGSWYENAEEHGEEFKKKMIDQILRYGLYKEIPDNRKDPLADMMFKMAKPLIDNNEKKRLAGRKGGMSKKGSAKSAYKHTSTNGNANCNVNANSNANVNVNNNAAPFLTSPEASQSEPEMVKIDVSKLKGRGNK